MAESNLPMLGQEPVTYNSLCATSVAALLILLFTVAPACRSSMWRLLSQFTVQMHAAQLGVFRNRWLAQLITLYVRSIVACLIDTG